MRPRKADPRRVGRLVVIALLLPVAACAGSADPLPGYTPASGLERASVVRTIEDYYAMRERAAVTGDGTELFQAYPALRQGMDRRRGINREAFFVENAPPEIIYMSHVLGWYAPIAVYVQADSAVAFAHSVEIFQYRSGGAGGGEVFVRFDLRRTLDRWLIERTDEQMMGEPPPRTPKP
jgi:hypothetical protein